MTFISLAWSNFTNCMSIIFTVCFAMSMFYSYGFLLSKFLKIHLMNSLSLYIVQGMALTSFIGWYTYKLGIPVNQTIIALSVMAILPILVNTKHWSRIIKIPRAQTKDLTNNYLYLLLVVLFFTIQLMVTFKFASLLVGRITNNDMFAWSMMADHFLGAVNIDNIMSEHSEVHHFLKGDAWGTYFILAVIAKISGLPALEATPCFVVLCLTLITYIIFEIIKKSFDLSNKIALLVAILTGSGSFMFYIAYNGFYAELLSTIFYLSLLLITIEMGDLHKSYFKSVIVLTLPFLGILLVYQVAFVVFSCFAILFFALHIVCNHYFGIKQEKISHVFFSLSQMPVALGLSFILIPELAYYVVERVMSATHTIAGWPLPLLSPLYFLSFPILPRAHALISWPSQYILMQYLLALGGITFVFLISKKIFQRQSLRFPLAAISLSIFFILTICAYLLFFLMHGAIYQSWKFAAYVILPTSFVMNAFVFKNMEQLFFRHHVKMTNVIIILCCFIVIFPQRSLEISETKIASLKAVRTEALANGVKNIIVAIAHCDDIITTFNYLSKDFKLFPLFSSYIPAAKPEVIDKLNKNITRVLVSTHCTASACMEFKTQ